MGRRLDEYETYYMSIIDRVGYIRIQTLKDCLYKYTKKIASLAEAEFYLYKLAESGHIVLSNDGWCMSKGKYLTLSQDKNYADLPIGKLIRLNSIDALNVSKMDKNIADCMSLVAELMPLSEDFVIGASPWYIQFIVKDKNEKEGRLYQVTTFRDGEEMAMGEIISTLPVPSGNSFREQMRRVAILDNKEMTWAVPKLGFAWICVINPNERSRLEIIEEREPDEMWSDYHGN